MFNKFKKQIGSYPCVDYLNNALRALLEEEELNKLAIREICYCLSYAQGQIFPDIEALLIKKGIKTQDGDYV